MRFFYASLCLAALFFVLSAAPPCVAADDFRPLTDSKGGRPRVTRVEMPHDALKAWQGHGIKGGTLVLFSYSPAIAPLDPRAGEQLSKGVAPDGWEPLLSKPYATPAYYPVQPSNYVSAAFRAGMVSKVYWVPPTKESVGTEPLAQFKEYLKGLGVNDSELGTLVQGKDSMRGVFGGIPFYISDLRHLPALKGDAVVMLDVSFFTELYKNEVKTPMLDLFSGFVGALGGRGLHASDVVISYSNAYGPVPLEYRFVGDYLYVWLTEPGRLADGPPLSWYLREQGMYYETFYQLEDVLQSYSDAVKADPKDASLRYAFSSAYFSAKDYDKFKQELEEAVELDPGYSPAYLTYGQYFLSENMPAAAEPMLDAAVKANPKDPAVWDAMYSLYTKKEDYHNAALAAQNLIDLGFNGPKPLSMRGDALRNAGSNEEAVKTYLKALQAISTKEDTLRSDILLGLAKTYESERKIKEAISTYAEAYESTSDEHVKASIVEQVRALREKWSPFLTPAP